MGRGGELEELELISEVPLDIESYSEDLREDVLGAIEDVLAAPPLVAEEEVAQSDLLGEVPLPEGAPRLIGISGKPRAGKDTLADYLLSHYQGVCRINFSDPIIEEVNSWLEGTGHSIWEGNKSEPVYRHLLQAWGMARRHEDPDYWTKQVRLSVQRLWDRGERLVLVCGVRALSDLEVIEDLGGSHWRVVRAGNDYQADHAIENQLDELDPSRVQLIENDLEGNLEAFHLQAKAALEEKRSSSS